MQKIKIMTWNLENLFTTDLLFKDKIAVRREVIKKIDPDVVAMQELGGKDALKALADGMYDNYMVSSFPGSRGITVGIMSKKKLKLISETGTYSSRISTEVYEIDKDGNKQIVNKMSRGLLHVEVEFNNDVKIEFIVVHLKSKLISYTNKKGEASFSPKDENERTTQTGLALLKRTAEAMTIRDLANEILEKDTSRRLVVLGDFNDVQDAATTQIIEGPEGSRLKTRGYALPDKGDDARLFNLYPLIDESRRYSRITNEHDELIDHIFASIEMMPKDRSKYPVVDSVVDYMGDLKSVGNDPNKREKELYSDHCPVVAEFEME